MREQVIQALMEVRNYLELKNEVKFEDLDSLLKLQLLVLIEERLNVQLDGEEFFSNENWDSLECYLASHIETK